LAKQQGNLPLGFALSIGIMLLAPASIGLVWAIALRRMLKPARPRWAMTVAIDA
jgi:hypothetical protein